MNLVGVRRGTNGEVKRPWNDARRKNKKKLADNHQAAMQTGGGSPAEHQELDDMEEMVATVSSGETVAGVGGPVTARHDQIQ